MDAHHQQQADTPSSSSSSSKHKLREFSLYAHFPFCSKLCGYCDFHKTLLNRSLERKFFAALNLEAELVAAELANSGTKGNLVSVYLGGGTPSLVDMTLFGEWVDTLRANFSFAEDLEFTVELNPESSQRENLEAFRQAGVNRLSVGVQSFNTGALARLDRRHKTNDTLRTFYLARALGYEDFSADLIFGLPDQTLAQLQDDLTQLVDLEPTHISYYQLTIKENTPLFDQIQAGTITVPDDDTLALYYRVGCEFLAEHGYERYEISSFARENKQSRHNLRYWSGEPYIAIGPGAHGFDGSQRYQVVSDTNSYVQALLKEGRRPLEYDQRSRRDWMIEDIMLGLRTTAGISRRKFQRRHGAALSEALDKKEFARLVESGHLLPNGDALRLSEDSFALADEIVARLVK